jgi:hypothetical protein
VSNSSCELLCPETNAGTPGTLHCWYTRMAAYGGVEEVATEVVVPKSSASVRVGITFESDEESLQSLWRQPRPKVKSLHPYGLAASNGLRVGDEIVRVNGQHVSSALGAAAMLRDGCGDLVLSVRRARSDGATDSGQPPRVPGLRMAHLPTAGGGGTSHGERDLREELDLGELTQRALRGIGGWFSARGDDLSRLLQPKHHAAAELIASRWRGHHCRVLLEHWRWAAAELARLRGGGGDGGGGGGLITHHTATEKRLLAHRAALTIQSVARGAIDRQWVLMLRAQTRRRAEVQRSKGLAAALALPDSRSGGGSKRVEKARRAFSFKRKQKPRPTDTATAAAAAEFGAKSLAAAAAAAAAGGDFTCPFDGCGAVTAVVAAAVEVARAGTMYTRCQRCDRTFALTLARARALAVTLTLTLPLTPTLFPP